MTSQSWTLATPWFDVALVTGLFAIGSILFGRFEEHKPRWRRVLKLILVTAIYLTVARTAGRVWATLGRYTLMLPPSAGCPRAR